MGYSIYHLKAPEWATHIFQISEETYWESEEFLERATSPVPGIKIPNIGVIKEATKTYKRVPIIKQLEND